MDLWIKIGVISLLALLIYREILKSAILHHQSPRPTSKAGFMSLLMITAVVGIFTYVGMSITWIETRDLRPYLPPHSPQMVSIFDKGGIELNGMVIKTNLAPKGELATLAQKLTQKCNGDEGCEVQSLFDYVTQIHYRTDYTSRSPRSVIQSNWGDCDDKSNLFASLLNERGYEYLFVYVPHHVFVVVHLQDTEDLPFLRASLEMEGKRFYYAETTAEESLIGEFNGEFPNRFEGLYDLRNDHEIPLEMVTFHLG